MRISRAAIDTLKGKIQNKIRSLLADAAPIEKELRERAKNQVLKELGLAVELKAWNDLKRKQEALDAEKQKLAEAVKEKYGEKPNSGYATLAKALEGFSYCPSRFDKLVEGRVATERSKTKIGQEILRLEKLLGDIDLSLELATSTAEVKQALRNILEQIGE